MQKMRGEHTQGAAGEWRKAELDDADKWHQKHHQPHRAEPTEAASAPGLKPQLTHGIYDVRLKRKGSAGGRAVARSKATTGKHGTDHRHSG